MPIIGPGITVGGGITITNTDLVTSGLLVFLDAANPTSYSGTGSTWTDLSGNGNNGTLVNSPVWTTIQGSRTFAFDGVTNRVTFTYATPVQSNSTAFTWNTWVWPSRNLDQDLLMGFRGTTLEFYKLTTQKFEMYPAEIFYQLPLNTWSNVSVVWNGPAGYPSNMLMYVNGVSVGVRNAQSPTFRATAMPFNLGGDSAANEYYNSYLSVAMIYNRALSAAEIQTNFNSYRGRFGI